MDIAFLLAEIDTLSFEALVSTIANMLRDCVGKSGKQVSTALEKVLYTGHCIKT